MMPEQPGMVGNNGLMGKQCMMGNQEMMENQGFMGQKSNWITSSYNARTNSYIREEKDFLRETEIKQCIRIY